MDYRQDILNGQGLKALTVPIYIPQARLGIGEAENKEFLHLQVQYVNKQPIVTAPPVTSRSFEQTQIDGQGAKLSIEDFPNNSFFVGSSLGGY
jgi:hypothetical protein